jgi:hypothetical protein
MKKIIAISVMFALFAGAVFAEANLGFAFAYKVVPAESDTAKGSVSSSTADNVNSHVNADFKNDDGTVGGRVRFYAAGKTGWWGAHPFAFAWWKPMDQLKVQFGHNPDGDWGGAQITGWGLNAGAQDFVAIDSDSDGTKYGEIWKNGRSAGFYPGYSNAGALVSIYPMDALSINIALPLSGNAHNGGEVKTYASYPFLHLNVAYNLEGMGTIRFSFVGKGGLEKTHHDPASVTTDQIDHFSDPDHDDFGKVGNLPGKSVGDLFASFYLTMIEGITLDFGVGFGLPYTAAETEFFTTTTTYKVNPGLQVGFGASYSGDGYGVKLRVGSRLAGSSTVTEVIGGTSFSGTAKDPTIIGVVILPYYNLDIFSVYLNVGFGMAMPEYGDNASDWYINPYIKKSVSNLNFFAGLKVGSPYKGNGDSHIHWAVPFGFDCSF